MQKFQLVLVPDWLGSAHKTGVEAGPAALEKAIERSDIRKNIAKPTYRISSPRPNPSHSRGRYSSVKYLPELKKMFQETQKKVMSVIQEGNIPLVLMGEDSSMMGVVSAVSKKMGNAYGIVWFDAHGDINTPKTSLTGRLYGMALAHLLGLGDTRLTALNGVKPSLLARNVVMLGQRSLDPGEKQIIRKEHIRVYTSSAINRRPASEIAGEIRRKFRKNHTKGLFIHIDLDCLEPVQSPGVSLQEPGGIAPKKLVELVGLLAREESLLLGVCVASYTPKADRADKTKTIALQLLTAIAESNVQ
ncbi:MAG: arginase family protein [Candidatus Burarchaeum sp.]|nr:arginase family protein [Candidatus Burarchaeum sp.]MDO8339232.1 arginase family protein [Candidatus Burarchaeum sp.]